MSEIISTRLRSMSSKDLSDLMSAINMLPYKVEIKTIVACPWDKRWYVTFVVPDSVSDMQMLVEL